MAIVFDGIDLAKNVVSEASPLRFRHAAARRIPRLTTQLLLSLPIDEKGPLCRRTISR
jgi:hypothetical protein